VASVSPDQDDQTDPFDDFAMVATPLGVSQLDLLRMDFVEDGIIYNKPSDAFLNKRFNLSPKRLRG